jgi:hypothetical protein
MKILNLPSFIGRKVLVGIPQWSTFGGSGAKSEDILARKEQHQLWWLLWRKGPTK